MEGLGADCKRVATCMPFSQMTRSEILKGPIGVVAIGKSNGTLVIMSRTEILTDGLKSAKLHIL